MTRWYASDQHFGHENIIKYCDRPFADSEEMNRAMLTRWNDLVSDDDEVWILGDLALGSLDANLAAWVAPLAGRKILVPGNHDRCWHGHKKNPKGHRVRYYQHGGIAQIVDHPEPHIIAGETVRLNHFPFANTGDHSHKGDGRTERYAEHRPGNDGGWLLHGHIHNLWRQRGRQINVGVDAWKFQPVPEETIARLIRRGPADRAML